MVQPDDGIRTQEGDILYKRRSSHRPTELSGFIRDFHSIAKLGGKNDTVSTY